jgi:hypothetical protein
MRIDEFVDESVYRSQRCVHYYTGGPKSMPWARWRLGRWDRACVAPERVLEVHAHHRQFCRRVIRVGRSGRKELCTKYELAARVEARHRAVRPLDYRGRPSTAWVIATDFTTVVPKGEREGKHMLAHLGRPAAAAGNYSCVWSLFVLGGGSACRHSHTACGSSSGGRGVATTGTSPAHPV